jgi:hypothetical protein
MNKQHFEAFAEEVREWRRIGREDELKGLKKDAANAFSMAMGIECATIKIGKRFNANFDEARFLAACNPEGGYYPKHPKA